MCTCVYDARVHVCAYLGAMFGNGAVCWPRGLHRLGLLGAAGGVKQVSSMRNARLDRRPPSCVPTCSHAPALTPPLNPQADVPDGAVRTVSAGILVAADGYFSRTKRQVRPLLLLLRPGRDMLAQRVRH